MKKQILYITIILLIIAFVAASIFMFGSALSTTTDKSKDDTLRNNYCEFNIIGDVVPNQYCLEKLRYNVDYIEELWDDRTFSFIVYDINKQCGISYKEEWKYQAQSIIKAPYIISLLEEQPDVFNKEKDIIYNVLTQSENSGYLDLRSRYGHKNLSKWCEELNLPVSIAEESFPRYITVNDITKLWMRVYNTNYSEEVKQLMKGSKLSVIYKKLGYKYDVVSKAGWNASEESDTVYGLSSSNDSGIIYDPDSPYIIVYFSNIPAENKWFEPLIDCFDEVHTSINNAS